MSWPAAVRAAAVALGLLLLSCGQARAEGDDTRSIYRVRPLTDGALIGLSGLAAVLPYAFTGQIIAERCPCDPNEINSFDRGAVGNDSQLAALASDLTLVAVMAGPPLLDGLHLGFSLEGPFAEDLTVYAEALAVNFALVSVVKHLTQRPLPVVYGGQAPELVRAPGGYRSFYSGHVSTAFTALSVTAVTLQERHGSGPWPWLAVVVVGASVAVERVAAGLHFNSDVLVGAAVGTPLGTTVPLLHLRDDPTNAVRLKLAPTREGFSLVGTF